MQLSCWQQSKCFEHEGKLMKKTIKSKMKYPSNAATQVAMTLTSHGGSRPKQKNGYWSCFHGSTHALEL
jgi:hypothetical protein